jgi:hypothetical protein
MTKTSSLRCSVRLAIAPLTLAAVAALAAPASSAAQSSLEPAVRLKLARSAADKAALHEVGLDFRDVYGVISAETSWVPRAGMGRNGVVSEGLAQFEPATAKAVGLKDPNDAVEAVHAAARLLREAAVWSAERVSRLGLGPDQRAAKLREGVSIYYNLSTRARSTWSGLNTASLPVETQRHIQNVREGALQADQLNLRLGGPSMPPLPPRILAARAPDRAAVVRAATAATAAPQALGTIEWSGKGGEGPGAGRRSYVVFSNGTVRPQ